MCRVIRDEAEANGDSLCEFGDGAFEQGGVRRCFDLVQWLRRAWVRDAIIMSGGSRLIAVQSLCCKSHRGVRSFD